ncbi:MAG: hypothetical protein D3906_13065 [Candidatus Electrothrix sp. AUS1_2]|nr:hypothetical protein [Candidatus Electrothrix sp. AUS1_2]
MFCCSRPAEAECGLQALIRRIQEIIVYFYLQPVYLYITNKERHSSLPVIGRRTPPRGAVDQSRSSQKNFDTYRIKRVVWIN